MPAGAVKQQRTHMAPKMARNSGDKAEGAKMLRSGKDKGDPAGVNRRPVSTMGRQTGRNITSQETRIESRRARVATKRLQGTVRKVAKSCTEIEAKLGTMDQRIVTVEEDVDTLKQQNAMQEGQLTDIMWKLEDFENRQRRNNLRFWA
ncbi:hypothetical protein NDU88_001867 [Pleurodeles waltl]|uniref:Uncharacterized protein n=1 Tax=Pleurodeles waltl TaxID=8319 RepID=A0AAV7W1P9_PLEWA|nr:hypothetical protein NDU88_001867 [Pleurodeles waltl]